MSQSSFYYFFFVVFVAVSVLMKTLIYCLFHITYCIQLVPDFNYKLYGTLYGKHDHDIIDDEYEYTYATYMYNNHKTVVDCHEA